MAIGRKENGKYVSIQTNIVFNRNNKNDIAMALNTNAKDQDNRRNNKYQGNSEARYAQKRSSKDDDDDNTNTKPFACWFCKREGHMFPECPERE
eukprot:6729809-Lingulodinium_polyedra.AAC.1